jgi:hypothetical protein
MLKVRISTGEHRREVPVIAPSARSLRTAPAAYQKRTCTRCGRHTTFVLDDPAGGWYTCGECGRLA